MSKYQRVNRGSVTNKIAAGVGSSKQYASQGAGQTMMSQQTSQPVGQQSSQYNPQKSQMSAKKQTNRVSQYVHKEQKSRNTNAHGIGASKTITDSIHQ